MIFYVLVRRELTDEARAILESRGWEIAFRFGPVSVGYADLQETSQAYAYTVRLDAQGATEARDRVAMALALDSEDAAALLVSEPDDS